MLKAFRDLPATLLALTALCLLLPVWSTFVHGLPTLARVDAVTLASLSAFWILPLALALAIAKRSIVTLPLFALEAVALIATSVFATEDEGVRFVRLALLLTMAAITPVLVRRDLLFPFLVRNRTLFRRHARFSANRKAQRLGKDGARHQLVIQDVSLSGIAVFGPREAFGDLTAGGDRAEAEISTHLGDTPFRMRARLTWYSENGLVATAGFEVIDPATLEAFVADVAREVPRGALSRRLDALVAHRGAAWAARGIWATAMLGSVGVPACGRDDVVKESYRTAKSAEPVDAGTSIAPSSGTSGAGASPQGVAVGDPVKIELDAKLHPQGAGFANLDALRLDEAVVELRCADAPPQTAKIGAGQASHFPATIGQDCQIEISSVIVSGAVYAATCPAENADACVAARLGAASTPDAKTGGRRTTLALQDAARFELPSRLVASEREPLPRPLAAASGAWAFGLTISPTDPASAPGTISTSFGYDPPALSFLGLERRPDEQIEASFACETVHCAGLDLSRLFLGLEPQTAATPVDDVRSLREWVQGRLKRALDGPTVGTVAGLGATVDGDRLRVSFPPDVLGDGGVATSRIVFWAAFGAPEDSAPLSANVGVFTVADGPAAGTAAAVTVVAAPSAPGSLEPTPAQAVIDPKPSAPNPVTTPPQVAAAVQPTPAQAASPSTTSPPPLPASGEPASSGSASGASAPAPATAATPSTGASGTAASGTGSADGSASTPPAPEAAAPASTPIVIEALPYPAVVDDPLLDECSWHTACDACSTQRAAEACLSDVLFLHTHRHAPESLGLAQLLGASGVVSRLASDFPAVPFFQRTGALFSCLGDILDRHTPLAAVPSDWNAQDAAKAALPESQAVRQYLGTACGSVSPDAALRGEKPAALTLATLLTEHPTVATCRTCATATATILAIGADPRAINAALSTYLADARNLVENPEGGLNAQSRSGLAGIVAADETLALANLAYARIDCGADVDCRVRRNAQTLGVAATLIDDVNAAVVRSCRDAGLPGESGRGAACFQARLTELGQGVCTRLPDCFDQVAAARLLTSQIDAYATFVAAVAKAVRTLGASALTSAKAAQLRFATTVAAVDDGSLLTVVNQALPECGGDAACNVVKGLDLHGIAAGFPGAPLRPEMLASCARLDANAFGAILTDTGVQGRGLDCLKSRNFAVLGAREASVPTALAADVCDLAMRCLVVAEDLAKLNAQASDYAAFVAAATPAARAKIASTIAATTAELGEVVGTLAALDESAVMANFLDGFDCYSYDAECIRGRLTELGWLDAFDQGAILHPFLLTECIYARDYGGLGHIEIEEGGLGGKTCLQMRLNAITAADVCTSLASCRAFLGELAGLSRWTTAYAAFVHEAARRATAELAASRAASITVFRELLTPLGAIDEGTVLTHFFDGLACSSGDVHCIEGRLAEIGALELFRQGSVLHPYVLTECIYARDYGGLGHLDVPQWGLRGKACLSLRVSKITGVSTAALAQATPAAAPALLGAGFCPTVLACRRMKAQLEAVKPWIVAFEAFTKGSANVVVDATAATKAAAAAVYAELAPIIAAIDETQALAAIYDGFPCSSGDTNCIEGRLAEVGIRAAFQASGALHPYLLTECMYVRDYGGLGHMDVPQWGRRGKACLSMRLQKLTGVATGPLPAAFCPTLIHCRSLKAQLEALRSWVVGYDRFTKEAAPIVAADLAATKAASAAQFAVTSSRLAAIDAAGLLAGFLDQFPCSSGDTGCIQNHQSALGIRGLFDAAPPLHPYLLTECLYVRDYGGLGNMDVPPWGLRGKACLTMRLQKIAGVASGELPASFCASLITCRSLQAQITAVDRWIAAYAGFVTAARPILDSGLVEVKAATLALFASQATRLAAIDDTAVLARLNSMGCYSGDYDCIEYDLENLGIRGAFAASGLLHPYLLSECVYANEYGGMGPMDVPEWGMRGKQCLLLRLSHLSGATTAALSAATAETAASLLGPGACSSLAACRALKGALHGSDAVISAYASFVNAATAASGAVAH